MLVIWKRTSSTTIADPRFGADARAVTVARSRAARRWRLAVDPRTGAVRLSLPARARLGDAMAWVESQRDWIEQQIAKMPTPAPIVPGGTLMLGDDRVLVDWAADRPRTVRRIGERLVVGGPLEAMPPRVLRWLRREALRLLTEETHFYAARAGVTIGAVGVGDTRSRWGSCAASGAIRYSWRLLLAPTFVRRATVAHEVAHRVHMNHGPDFHALVAQLLDDDPAPARAWLRQNGAALHWIGRG